MKIEFDHPRFCPAAVAIAMAGVLCYTGWCGAQTVTQKVHLEPGWNAVFLKVQPGDPRVKDLVGAVPIRTIRQWAPSATAPVKAFPLRAMDERAGWGPGSGWATYAAGSDANTLHALEVGGCYMVELAPGSAPVDWVVRGRPVVVPRNLVANGDNLIGVSVDPDRPPTISACFADSASLANGPFHLLGQDGKWAQVQRPDQQVLTDGMALVARCGDWTDYPGPVRVVPEQRGGLDFGGTGIEQRVRFVNLTAQKQDLQVDLVPVVPADPPGGNDAPDASLGDVRLAHWDFRPPHRAGWFPLGPKGLFIEIPANGTVDLRLSPMRQEMLVDPEGMKRRGVDPARVIADGLAFQGILRVRGAGGATAADLAVRSSGLAVGADGAPRGREGLWVGWASVSSVSRSPATQPAERPTTRPTRQPVSRPFDLKVLVHVDAQGRAHLLRQAIEVFDRKKNRYVLTTDETQARERVGNAAGLGAVGRRFVTTAFGFRDPLPLSAAAGADPKAPFGQGPLTVRVVLPYDDPRSPFVHPFHPDHDNRDERFEKKLGDGAESFTVTRDLTLDFTRDDPDKLMIPGWGDTQIGGRYRETITGLHRQLIRVEGTFRLHRASAVAELVRTAAPVKPPG